MDSQEVANLINQYGYVAIVIGAFIEGEIVVLIAGFLAHQGYVHPQYVALAAFAGSLGSDQLLFFLGRSHGEAVFKRFPRFAAKVKAVEQRLRGHEASIIIGFRFLYGLRNITPFLLGMNRTPPRLFIPLNVLGAAIWAVLFTLCGYLAGNMLTRLLGRLHRYEPAIIAGIVLLGASVAYWLHKRAKRAV